MALHPALSNNPPVVRDPRWTIREYEQLESKEVNKIEDIVLKNMPLERTYCTDFCVN